MRYEVMYTFWGDTLYITTYEEKHSDKNLLPDWLRGTELGAWQAGPLILNKFSVMKLLRD